MRSSARSLFTTIRTEGAILPSELLERIAKGKDFDGLSTDSYHLLAGQKLNEVIERSWKQVLVAWRGFNDTREKTGDLDATGTSLTRERWLYPLFQELGFGRMPAERKAREIEGREYPISHFYDHVPVHMVGYKILIDRRTPGIPGAAKTAPHSLVQEFLNRTEEHLWAIVSNGLRLRLLRDNKSLTRQAYVEFDLEAMLQGDAFADFRVLWLLCHQSRFEAEKPTDCWLEKWSKIASEQGVRALDKLRGGVEEAIRALGKGFLAHPANHELRRQLRDGDLDKQEYYRQVLRVVYRLLFLFVAEDRDLLLLPELQGDEPDEAKRQRRLARVRFQQHYGTQRLRGLSQTIRGTQHPDLWRGLQLIMRGLGQEGGIPALAVPALGSYLWSDAACPDLAGMGATPAADIANIDFLVAIRALAVIEVEGRRTVVNYAHLRSEELGSVYESLLELHPNLNAEAGTFDLHSAAGNERKTTGSYYTPDSLVQCLLDSALEPVMDEKEALARKVAQKIASGRVERSEWSPEELDLIIPHGADPDEALAVRMVELLNMEPADRHRTLREAALLGMRVCDPACGSGHFLIAAAHRIARRVARARTGDEEPTPEALQHAMRDVVGRCLYGVDINAMALELAKVALWMEAIEPGKPLGFLDAHFQCGNALLGTTPDLIEGGLPDGAFNPITGDEKSYASGLKKQNKKEREKEEHSFLSASGTALDEEVFAPLAREAQALFEANADSLAEVRRIAENYEAFKRTPAYRKARFLADLWCAAFVWPKVDSAAWSEMVPVLSADPKLPPPPKEYPEPPTDFLLQRCATHAEPWTLLTEPQAQMLLRLAEEYRLLHWHVNFADIFQRHPNDSAPIGGFDVMLGNPPWERVKIQEKEWFATRDPEVAGAANASERGKKIKALIESDPTLYNGFQLALRVADGEASLMRNSGRFPTTGVGDVNTYATFVETARDSMSSRGRVGIIVPTGVATSDTLKQFFASIVSGGLVSLFSFWETRRIFLGTDSREPFCLLTLQGSKGTRAVASLAFDLHSTDELLNPLRIVYLRPEDFVLLNPNTRTCPIFRDRRDAELTKAIYRRWPVLWKEDGPEENPWRLKFLRMLDMANDSGLFRTAEWLQTEGYSAEGNAWVRPESRYLPLYEAKMVHHFNHRFGDYRDKPEDSESTALPDVPAERLADPDYQVTSRYWVPDEQVRSRSAQVPRGLYDLACQCGEPDKLRALLMTWAGGYFLNHGLQEQAEALLFPGTTAKKRAGEAAEKARRQASEMDQTYPLQKGEATGIVGALESNSTIAELASELVEKRVPKWLMGWRDICRSGDERTCIFAAFPFGGVGHTSPLWFSGHDSCRTLGLLGAFFSSFAFDYIARQKIGGTHLTYGFLKQLPVPPPNKLAENQIGSSLRGILELFISAWDLEPFARDCGYDGPPFIWDEERRFWIRAELDAAFFHLYLGTPEEWTRTGSPELIASFPTPRHAVDYIMETFPIVKRKDEKAHGTYRTKLAILDIYDQMAEAISTGQPYQTALTPPPGPPTDTEGNFIPMAQWDANNWPKHIHKPKETATT